MDAKTMCTLGGFTLSLINTICLGGFLISDNKVFYNLRFT